MKRIITLAWCICGLGLAFLPFEALSETKPDTLILYLGETQIVPASNLTRIVIRNPSIIDVAKVTRDEVTITPKAPGTTVMSLWDNFGEQPYDVVVYKENMQEIKRRVDKLLATLGAVTVSSKADDEEAKVILTGTVKSQEEKDRIALALGTLKDKVVDLLLIREEETGIEISVQLIELLKDATKSLGFTTPTSITITEQGSPAISTSGLSQVGTTSEISGGTSVGTKWQYFFKVLNLSRDAFQWTLEALEQTGKARVLSRPRLLCQSGKEAELMVGGEKPIFTSNVEANVGTSTNVTYKEYGIKLKIKPVVTADRRIKLVLNVEVSDIGTADIIGSLNAPTAKAYPLKKRTISTELYLDDNQTLAIGGLMQQKQEETITKTAGLGDIPILGALFRNKVVLDGGGAGEKGNTELFITLTPNIVGAPAPSPGKSAASPNISPAALAPEKAVPEPLRQYSAIVQKHIVESIKYPASAKNAGFQGAVILRLHLSYTGEFLGGEVKSSSGYKVLDEHALSTARAIGTYPPFPPEVTQQEMWLEVPIVYSLE